jgi:Raf kinase inhibitor-like YbhB/YbcL family protein
MTITPLQARRLLNGALACAACAALIAAGLSGCRQASINDRVPMSLMLTSTSFQPGDNMPEQFSCHGANISPSLSWGSLPANTKSLALLVTDPDSLFGSYVHWVLYNLPPESSPLPEGLPRSEVLPNGAKQGVNTGDEIGYQGPCPPGKSVHRYVFTLYALDTMLNPPSPVNKKHLMHSMEGHVLAAGQLIGRYHR